MRPTPLQHVKKSFENRATLVEKLVPLVDKQNGDATDDQVKSRLMGLSNKKLLRLYKVEQSVRERFGDRAKLVAHIVDERKKAGLSADDKFKEMLETYSKARLLDLANMKHADRPGKRTPEVKLKLKRGKKARARAMSAMSKRKS